MGIIRLPASWKRVGIKCVDVDRASASEPGAWEVLGARAPSLCQPCPSTPAWDILSNYIHQINTKPVLLLPNALRLLSETLVQSSHSGVPSTPRLRLYSRLKARTTKRVHRVRAVRRRVTGMGTTQPCPQGAGGRAGDRPETRPLGLGVPELSRSVCELISMGKVSVPKPGSFCSSASPIPSCGWDCGNAM